MFVASRFSHSVQDVGSGQVGSCGVKGFTAPSVGTGRLAGLVPDGSCPARLGAEGGSCPSSECSPPRSPGPVECNAAQRPSQQLRNRRIPESNAQKRHVLWHVACCTMEILP